MDNCIRNRASSRATVPARRGVYDVWQLESEAMNVIARHVEDLSQLLVRLADALK